MRHLIIGLLLPGLVLSCTRETLTEPPTPDTEAVLLLDFNFPAGSSVTPAPAPLLRAGFGGTDEHTIQSVDVLSFLTDDSDPTNIKKGTFYYHAVGQYDPLTRKVRVLLNADSHAQTLVVVANAHDRVVALNAHAGEDKETVMNRFRVPSVMSSIPALNPNNGQPWEDGYMKGSFTVTNGMIPDFAKGMPMWGELPNQTIDRNYPSSEHKVTLIRSVAKVTIKAVGDIEPICDIRLFNTRTGGRMSPDHIDVSNPLHPKVHTPTVPAGTTPVGGSSVTCDLRQVHSGGISWAYYNHDYSFYLFESDSKSKSQNEVTGFVVGGQYFGHGGVQSWGYYRIDFKDYATGTKLDVLRNHHYVVTLPPTATVPPAATPEDAWKGNHVLHAKVEDWDTVQEDVDVPGTGRLEVNRRSIIFAPKSNQEETLTITTDGTDGWTLTDVPSWITVQGGTVRNVDGTHTITLRTSGNPDFRSGKLTLQTRSGRPTKMEIFVGQRRKIPLDYVAEYNLIGENKKLSSVEHRYKSILNINGPLRFTDSHKNDRSGYYHRYDVMLPGYHIPKTRHELSIIFPPQATIELNKGDITKINQGESMQYPGGSTNPVTYNFDYKVSGGIIYAIRFKKREGHGTYLAQDNSLRCAYRYTRVGNPILHDPDFHYKVEAIYLGENPAITLDVVSQYSWWEQQIKENPHLYVKRIFPACGSAYIYSSRIYSSERTQDGIVGIYKSQEFDSHHNGGSVDSKMYCLSFEQYAIKSHFVPDFTLRPGSVTPGLGTPIPGSSRTVYFTVRLIENN